MRPRSGDRPRRGGPAGRDAVIGRGGPPGFAARKAAAAAVAAVLDGEATLDDALARQPGGDVPLAKAIAVATFRRFGTIRAALADRMPKGLPRDNAVLAVLATGAAQVLVLDVADHAAVDLSVELARAGPRTRHLAGMVNAILRRLARERDAILQSSPPALDLPDWLGRRWRATYGEDRTERLAAANRAGAALDLTCRRDAAGWAERLEGALLPTGSVRLSDRRAVEDLPGYGEGAWWVQDAAAALPVRWLAPQQGERVLDMCAAPGGKTAQLAAAGAVVTALDRSETRLKRLTANLSRLGLSVDIIQADATLYEAEPFDAVLLDAPCTATGAIRRHPDIPWIKGEADMVPLVGLQSRLLDRAAALLRPGGRLVYCVCSLEPEEGERQADAFLGRHPGFARHRLDAGALGLDDTFLTPDGDLRTAADLWPPAEDGARAGLDGFFAALLVKDGRGPDDQG